MSRRRPSQTAPGQSYKVEVNDGGGVCDCLGHRTHNHCRHVEELREELNMQDTETDVAVVPFDGEDDELPRALEVSVPRRLLPTGDELAVMGRIASTLVKARGHAIPASIDSPAKAAAVMLAGWELGLKPMTAFRHIFVVNGRTEPDAQAMMGLVRAGDPSADFTFHAYTAEGCDVELHRNGRSVARCEYTLEDAKASGQLAKAGPWQSYPRDMCVWSAVKRVCRLGAPDLINAFASVSVGEAGGLIGSLPEESGSESTEEESDE